MERIFRDQIGLIRSQRETDHYIGNQWGLHRLTFKFPFPDLVDRGQDAEQDTHSSQDGADGGDDNCECEHRSQTFQRVVFVPIWKRKKFTYNLP